MKWVYSNHHKKPLKVIDEQELWGEKILQVLIPGENRVENVSADAVIPIEDKKIDSINHIVYTACSSKIADALDDLMVSPMSGSLIPLPHQLEVLSKAMKTDKIRFLLSDEVGLGKTIEAGMVFKELKIRGLLKRVLIIAPKGLVIQWISEMRTHFNETFHFVVPGEMSFFKVFSYSDEDLSKPDEMNINYWKHFDQVICSLDSVKPLEKRKGWTREQVEKYNMERFDNLIQSGWDMVIIDEAHRVAGASDTVARHALGRGLADAAPYILLLTATPHSGKSDSFRRLMSLVDEEEFADMESLSRERVEKYVIRTEKRMAIDYKGEKLFKPRNTRMLKINWTEGNETQRELYKAVTELVRKGYNRRAGNSSMAKGLIKVLLQRLVTSSTDAIVRTLQKHRFDLLDYDNFMDESVDDFLESLRNMAEESGLDTGEIYRGIKSFNRDEIEEINHIMELAKETKLHGPDVKTIALTNLIYDTIREEGDPELKFLIFTEFTATQKMLEEYLKERGFDVVVLNGSMEMEERMAVQKEFAKSSRVMISTDAGGEGLNLQFCHVVINYDIPWAPTKLEQRIGRVDRIGQQYPVKAYNFLLEETVEARVFEILQEKLQRIFAELGVDKTSDILDTLESETEFRDLYMNALLHPDEIEDEVEKITKEILQRAREAKDKWEIFGTLGEIKPESAQNILGHPLPYWIEKMVINYLESHNGTTERKVNGYDLFWDDGKVMKDVTFSRDESLTGIYTQLSLENEKIMEIVKNLPCFVCGERIPVVSIEGLSAEIKGFWALWKISLSTSEYGKDRIIPIFRQDDGRVFKSSAQRIWDSLMADELKMEIKGYLSVEDSVSYYTEIDKLAQLQGENAIKELKNEYEKILKKEEEKAEYAYNAKFKAIMRIGLPEVRNYRLKQLKTERETRMKEMSKRNNPVPGIQCITILNINGN